MTHPVARLAVPAFFTLVAEPLFLLTDSAVVGHLGTTSLAALGAASAVLLTATGIFVFLAYATTSVVARHIGLDDPEGAVQAGLDGVWLSVALGIPLAGLTALLAEPASRALSGSGGREVVEAASTYLQLSALGVPAMLISLAAQGLLRGLQDTRTPLWVTGIGFAINAGLNAFLVLVADQGLAGSAIGTVVAQWLMALALLTSILRRTRHVDVRPHPSRVLAAARFGAPLLVRTVALRAVLLLTTASAGWFGATTLAAHQIAMTIFTFLTFALDAIAIAAQALIGESLGRGDVEKTRSLSAVIARWGWNSGVVAGALTLLAAWPAPHLFSTDPSVRRATSFALVVIGLVQPVAGVLFVLDGVLMGAGDGRFLARAQVLLLVAYVPVIALLVRCRGTLAGLDVAAPLVALWLCYCANLVARCVVLERRRRAGVWMDVTVP